MAPAKQNAVEAFALFDIVAAGRVLSRLTQSSSSRLHGTNRRISSINHTQLTRLTPTSQSAASTPPEQSRTAAPPGSPRTGELGSEASPQTSASDGASPSGSFSFEQRCDWDFIPEIRGYVPLILTQRRDCTMSVHEWRSGLLTAVDVRRARQFLQ